MLKLIRTYPATTILILLALAVFVGGLLALFDQPAPQRAASHEQIVEAVRLAELR